MTSRPVKTFSTGFEGAPDYDEVDFAEEAARTFGTEHTSLRVTTPAPELFEKLVHYHDGPFGDSSAIPTFMVSELARRDVTVVLNGDGGDELFAGYSRLAAAAFSERIPRGLRRAAAWGGKMLPAPRRHKSSLRRIRSLLLAAALPLNERIQSWCSLFRGGELGALFPGASSPSTIEPGGHFAGFLAEAAEATPLAQVLYLTYCTYLPDDLLVKMDRMSMAHSLEARSPFLDAELTEFAARLPDHLKLRPLTTKVVLRDAFRELVPERIVKRGKMGFGAPLGAWLRNDLRRFVESRLGAGDKPLFHFLDEETVGTVVGEHMNGVRDRSQQIFCLLTLSLWLESFR